LIGFTRQNERINNASRRLEGNRGEFEGRFWLYVRTEEREIKIAERNQRLHKGTTNLRRRQNISTKQGKEHKEVFHMLIPEEHCSKAASPKSANARVCLATRQ
jgi:hypothetical protein